MCDGRFSASSIGSSFTGADHFSVWLLTEETTSHRGALKARKIWVFLSLLASKDSQSPLLIILSIIWLINYS